MSAAEDILRGLDLPTVPTNGASEERSNTKEGPKPPAADEGMFRGILGEIVAAADGTTEADSVGVYATLLAGVGVLAGQRPHVQVGNTRHPLLVWPLLFGRTGTGRKGEASETAETFLRTGSPEGTFLRTAVSGLSSGEGLIERIRDPDEKGEGGTEEKRLYVLEPEFASVMARAKREGSTLASVLRQAWDGKALAVLNRKKLAASASHIAIVGHVTPAEFRVRLAEADMAGGTFNRFMPVWVERSKRLPIPEGIDRSILEALAPKLSRAVNAAREIDRVRLGKSAAHQWTAELYDELTDCDDEDHAWTEFTRRAAPYCLRIAALTAVLDGRDLIDAGDLAAAASLVRYSVGSARYVLGSQHRDPRIDRITRALDAAGKAGLTRTEISGLFSRNLPFEALSALLDEITGGGEYMSYDRRTGGRPAVYYCRVPAEAT